MDVGSADANRAMTTRGWLLFAAVSLLWGIPYGLIKVAVDGGMTPSTLAAARVTIGAALLLPLAWRAGALTAVRGRLRWIALYSVAEIAVPFPLLAIGERHVSSSLAAILIATSPLFVALLALRFDTTERLTRRRLAGVAIGLAGVVALVGIDTGRHSHMLVGVGCVLTVAFGYAIAPMILKGRLSDLDPRATIGVSLALAAAVLVPAAAVDHPAATPSLGAIAAVVGLGTLCTAAALALYGALVTTVGAGRALVVTYLNPVVAIALGVLALGEPLGRGPVIGLALILTGAWFATDGRLPAISGPALRTPRTFVHAVRTQRRTGRGSSSRTTASAERTQ